MGLCLLFVAGRGATCTDVRNQGKIVRAIRLKCRPWGRDLGKASALVCEVSGEWRVEQCVSEGNVMQNV